MFVRELPGIRMVRRFVVHYFVLYNKGELHTYICRHSYGIDSIYAVTRRHSVRKRTLKIIYGRWQLSIKCRSFSLREFPTVLTTLGLRRGFVFLCFMCGLLEILNLLNLFAP